MILIPFEEMRDICFWLVDYFVFMTDCEIYCLGLRWATRNNKVIFNVPIEIDMKEVVLRSTRWYNHVELFWCTWFHVKWKTFQNYLLVLNFFISSIWSLLFLFHPITHLLLKLFRLFSSYLLLGFGCFVLLS